MNVDVVPVMILSSVRRGERCTPARHIEATERESRYGVYIYVFIYVLRNIYRQDSGEEIVIYMPPHVARDGTEEYAAPSSAYVRW